LLISQRKTLLMGFFYTILTALLLSLTGSNAIPYEALEDAFTQNNANEIVEMGKDKILLNILGKEGAYSQSQAALVIKEFFIKKSGTSFKFTFKGKESTDGSFAIGTYISNQESFRVTIHFKKITQEFKIESLVIEKS
jgi:hypothetical protein